MNSDPLLLFNAMRHQTLLIRLILVCGVVVFCFKGYLMGQEASTARSVHPSIAHLDEAQLTILEGHLKEIRVLANARRAQGMLAQLDDAMKIAPKYHLLYNLRGAAYSILRDFESAKREFEVAQSLEPKALDVRFNLAEMDYVTGNYAEALVQLTSMITENPKMPTETYHLLRIKEIICLLKLERGDEAAKLGDEFTPYEDTPVYHIARAAQEFAAGDEVEARGWIRSAQGIFNTNQMTNYLDALIEVGWIDPFIEANQQ